MQKFDLLTVLGLFLGVTAVVGGFHLEGGNTQMLWELTALLIVLGGTTGAIIFRHLSLFLYEYLDYCSG